MTFRRIVGWTAGKNSDAMLLRQCLNDQHRILRGGRSIRGVILIQNQDVQSFTSDGSQRRVGVVGRHGGQEPRLAQARPDWLSSQHRFSGGGATNQEVAEHQRIHSRSQEAVDRFLGPANNRLVVVE